MLRVLANQAPGHAQDVRLVKSDAMSHHSLSADPALRQHISELLIEWMLERWPDATP